MSESQMKRGFLFSCLCWGLLWCLCLCVVWSLFWGLRWTLLWCLLRSLFSGVCLCSSGFSSPCYRHGECRRFFFGIDIAFSMLLDLSRCTLQSIQASANAACQRSVSFLRMCAMSPCLPRRRRSQLWCLHDLRQDSHRALH